MKIIFILITLIFIAFTGIGTVVEPEPFACLPGLLDPHYGQERLTDLEIASFRNIPVIESFGIVDGRFNLPYDNIPLGEVLGNLEGGDPDFYDAAVMIFISPSFPEFAWLFVYDNIEPDGDGGIHPCSTWKTNRDEINYWLLTIGE